MTKTALTRAARLWVAALNSQGDRTVVEEAIIPRAVLWRCVADEPETPPQRISGARTIEKWLASAPAKARFSLVPKSAEIDEEQPGFGKVRYKVKVGPFENFGTWELRLARDGRIRSLLHRPDDLPAKWRAGQV